MPYRSVPVTCYSSAGMYLTTYLDWVFDPEPEFFEFRWPLPLVRRWLYCFNVRDWDLMLIVCDPDYIVFLNKLIWFRTIDFHSFIHSYMNWNI